MKPVYKLCLACSLYHPAECATHLEANIKWLRFTTDELDGMFGVGGWINEANVLKNYSVTIKSGCTTHVVGINAQNHEKAEQAALDVIGKTYEQVNSIVVTPQQTGGIHGPTESSH